ncbi:hypothetical protein HanPSC8_Chr12g0541361 [Helianthus annuus]|nr:hypothetical protein HanPSC8_Chr12g0541361 [Helianthus annuus]
MLEKGKVKNKILFKSLLPSINSFHILHISHSIPNSFSPFLSLSRVFSLQPKPLITKLSVDRSQFRSIFFLPRSTKTLSNDQKFKIKFIHYSIPEAELQQPPVEAE